MANSTRQFASTGVIEYDGMIDLTTSGAISASRGEGITFARASAGVYTATLDEIFYDCLGAFVDLSEATVTSAGVRITDIDLQASGGAVITFSTFDDNATPAAADLAAGSVSFRAVFRRYPTN